MRAAEDKRESLDVRIRAPLRFLWSFQSGRLCTRRALFGLARLQGTERAMMAYDNAPFHVQEHAAQLDGHAVWGSRGPTEYLIIRQVSAGYTKSTGIETGVRHGCA
jgi:hypothetical protein